MLRGRTLSLDIGSKRTGVACSDEYNLIASPLMVVEAVGLTEWIQRIMEVVEMEEPARIVVGLPLDNEGEPGRDAANIRKYIALLRERVQVPVIEWDERYTTVEAERVLLEGNVSRRRRKQVIDKIAAAIILKSYLEHGNHRELPDSDPCHHLKSELDS
jgi:putative holliday junction resolvase